MLIERPTQETGVEGSNPSHGYVVFSWAFIYTFFSKVQSRFRNYVILDLNQ
jgi:hypothetical protein